jgi:hypothetical protein
MAEELNVLMIPTMKCNMSLLLKEAVTYVSVIGTGARMI